MKKLLLILFAAALCSCGGASYTVTGNLGRIEGTATLSTTGSESTVLASTEVGRDGSFQLTGRIKKPVVVQLTIDTDPVGLVFLEPGVITVAPTYEGFDISGTVSNDLFNALHKMLGEIQTELYTLGSGASDEEVQALYDKYNDLVSDNISDNLDNLYGAFLFTTNESEGMEPAQARERLAQFTPEIQQTDLLTHLSRILDAIDKTQVGQPYIKLNLPNTSGDKIALSSFVGDGKWVLIDFWATWCAPCRVEFPHLWETYNLYKEKGFTIYGVSIDSNTEVWRKFISANDTPWPNVIAEEKGPNPTAELYGIRSVPQNFLIGPDGRIVAINLRGAALKEKLAEVLP